MSKSKPPPPLAEAQLEIMNFVWDRGEATVGQIWRELSARRRVARNTIQTMVVRLEEKGWLRHRTEGNAFVYAATAARQTALKRMVRQLVDTAFAGSAEGLVMTLLEDQGLPAEEAERIRRMIAKAKGKKPRKYS